MMWLISFGVNDRVMLRVEVLKKLLSQQKNTETPYIQGLTCC